MFLNDSMKDMIGDMIRRQFPDLPDQVQNIGNTVIEFKKQMDRIENDLALIMGALRIERPNIGVISSQSESAEHDGQARAGNIGPETSGRRIAGQDDGT